MKRGDISFNPTEPPEVKDDPKDQNEMPEPYPLVSPPPTPDKEAEMSGEEDN